MKLVLVDVDGTLIRGLSSEQAFILSLLRRRRIPARRALSWLYFTARWLPRYGGLVTKKNKTYLAGMATHEVAALAREFVFRSLSKRICAKLRSRLTHHLRCGDHVVLLTGTPDFIAAPLAELLGAADYRATICAARNGRFICAPPLSHPHGLDKLAIARELSADLHIPMHRVVAYADSNTDLHLLRAVGHPVAVNSDLDLRAAAGNGGWETIDCRP